MAEYQPTAAQRAAVEDRGGALLVSAAAGSGKTRVLVDRLLGMVCDPVSPKNIDDFLIITYTNAAAAELREKIASELSRRLSEDPGNRHLARQMNRLYLAQISTVHAFCTTILRAWAHTLDLPADFRVAEEQECDVLRQESMERVIEQSYAALDGEPAVRQFIDTLGYGRDDRRVAEIAMQAYRSALCHADPVGWLQACAAQAQRDGEEPLATVWGAALLSQLRSALQRSRRLLAAAAEEGARDPVLAEKYVPTFRHNMELLDELLALDTWDAFFAQTKPDFGRLGTVRAKDASERQEWMKDVRHRCAEDTKKLLGCFYAPAAQVMEDQRSGAATVCGIFTIVERFMEDYGRQKRRRHLLDFSDLEHEAVRLLTFRDTGLPTQAAREIAEKYEQVMVDEYQDSNEVQDRIFRAVSRDGRNLFMVGDVKQSIYSFRLADPTIFLEKYRRFAPRGEQAPDAPRKVLLSENFRSHEAILDAVNCVFRTVMHEQTGGLEYGEAEALRPGKQWPAVEEPLVELHCIDTGGSGADGEDEEETPEKTAAEAAVAARRIKALLQEQTLPTEDGPRRIEPQDITILLRSLKNDAGFYLSALQALGIPACCDAGQSILDTQELDIFISLLQLLDNPHQDIPLIAAMTSPVFGISNDLLGAVRTGRREGDLFDALLDAAPEQPVLRDFLSVLDELREEAELLPLGELLRLLVSRLSLRALFGAMPQGRQRVANLDTFMEFASGYARQGQKTLHSFLVYLDGLREQGISGGTALQRADAVRIMSIHKSKGLEFPVVVLCGLSKKFNFQDLSAALLTHPKLGAGCNLVDPANRVTYSTAARRAISLQLRQERISEELRVLYVAMTRPRTRLIMTYCSNSLAADLRRTALWLRGGDAADAAADARCPGDWVLLTAMGRTEAGALAQYAGCSLPASVSSIAWRIRVHEENSAAARRKEPESGLQTEEPRPALPGEETLRRNFAFSYPHAAATRLPTKVTATQLKGRTLDTESAEQAQQLPPRAAYRFEKPRLAAGAKPLTPAQKGTAIHLAMQFLRYEACATAEGIRAELDRLCRAQFLTPEQRAAVPEEKLLRFFTSALGQRVLHAEKVIREFKFSLLTDGSLLSPEAAGEEVLLQGVTDCCMVENGALVILDFKSDRIRAGTEAAAAEYYRGQLDAYSMALQRIFSLPVRERLLYFFATDTAAAL